MRRISQVTDVVAARLSWRAIPMSGHILRGSSTGRPEVVERGGLRKRIQQLEQEKDSLTSENCRLRKENASQAQRIEELEQEVCRLKRELEASQKAAKRQAAPFSKGRPSTNPHRPGRKRGKRYGKKGHRMRPPRIDERYEAVLPQCCPHCQGQVHADGVCHQYQVEIPAQPIYREFTVHVGHCGDCGRRIQGHHPLQTSDALGAASSQLGPHLQAAIVWLNKHAGLSHGKIVAALRQIFGIDLSRGGSAHVVLRMATRCQTTVDQLEGTLHSSPWIVGDETGWKVGGHPAWLHTIVGDQATRYRIDSRRSACVQAEVVGADYSGVVVHDGYSSYNRRFPHASHQQCIQHLLRRARRILETCPADATEFPKQVIELVRIALDWRDQYRHRRKSRDELAEGYLGLWRALEELLHTPEAHRNAANRKLAKHLEKHAREWFWFLLDPTIDATNYRAEQALRPGVVNRKVWGGNRTPKGRTAQEDLMSVLETARRRGMDPICVLQQILLGKPPPLATPA